VSLTLLPVLAVIAYQLVRIGDILARIDRRAHYTQNTTEGM
jgi:hypothetical protein